MKPVLILQHLTLEHPAYLRTWLESKGISSQVVVWETARQFPTSMDEYSALAVLGGSMSANYDFLSNRQAEILILQAIYRDKPVIGHCLGGQLMTRALGGTVSQSPAPEVGWQPITWIDCPESVDWFGTNPMNTVMHWHYESFTIPDGATLVATSDACPNQAWALGKHLAMQFHIEADAAKTTSWVTEDFDPRWEDAAAKYTTVQTREQILEGIETYMAPHQDLAGRIYTKWLSTTEWSHLL